MAATCWMQLKSEYVYGIVQVFIYFRRACKHYLYKGGTDIPIKKVGQFADRVLKNLSGHIPGIKKAILIKSFQRTIVNLRNNPARVIKCS